MSDVLGVPGRMKVGVYEIELSTNRDGWHVARCRDLPGLLVVHPDQDVVIKDVPNVIEALLRADGREVDDG